MKANLIQQTGRYPYQGRIERRRIFDGPRSEFWMYLCFLLFKFCFKSDGCTWFYACFLFAFDKFQVAKESKERNTMACHEPGEARKRKVDKEASVCATAGVAGTIPICFERRKRFDIIISFAFWCKFQSFYIIPAFAKLY